MRLLFFFSLLVFVVSACHFKHQDADLVIYNATIYTLDENNSVQQAIAIKDGKIVALGKDRDILNNFRYTESIDAAKQTIYPGFIDAHCHFVNYGFGLEQANLVGCKSFGEMLQRVADFSKANPEKSWIIGRGWDHTDWPGKMWPDKRQLDILFPKTPVILQRIDGHAALVNQAALDVAKITSNSKINGGFIGIENGQLTGLIKENTIDSVSKCVPKPTLADYEKALAKAQNKCFEAGITSVADAGLKMEDIEALKALHGSSKLLMRVYAMASDNDENFSWLSEIGRIKTDRLNVSSFKFYADGSLGSRSACLLKPYHDENGNTGMLTIDLEKLEEKLRLLYEMHFQANTHCIGDSANRAILSLYGKILKGTNDRRWRIEHAQVVDPEDFAWFGKYTIIPSVQPTHATSDMKWAGDRLGDERLPNAYALKKLLGQNGFIALGTDFPVEDISPLATFYTAVFRQNLNQIPGKGFLPENALSRMEALKGMTIWAAMANFEEEEKGSLEKGKFADLVILDRDILKVDQSQVLKARVKATFVGGQKVFSN